MRSPYQNDFWKDPIDGYFAETGICHNERICLLLIVMEGNKRLLKEGVYGLSESDS